VEKAQEDMTVAASLVSPAAFVTAIVGQATGAEPEPSAAVKTTSRKRAAKGAPSSTVDQPPTEAKKPRALRRVK